MTSTSPGAGRSSTCSTSDRRRGPGAADSDLSLLAAALHRLNVEHSDAVVAFAGTGLPSTLDVLIKAGVTHPDRLFDLRPIPLTLSPEDARYAIVEPVRMQGVVWDADGASGVVQVSNGYPAHLQLFADETWKTAPGPNQILAVDVEEAIPRATAAIERRSLGPRWERMSERQMELITALALHGGTASTAALAQTLGRARTDLSWVRDDCCTRETCTSRTAANSHSRSRHSARMGSITTRPHAAIALASC
jgi:hypothetical protein